MKTQTRKMTTTYSNYWLVQLTNQFDESPTGINWLVKIDRPAKRGKDPSRQTAEEVQAEIKEAIEQVKALDIDNGPDGEFADYPLFDAKLCEWCGTVSELP